MKAIKGEKTGQRAKQKEDPLSCSPSGAALLPGCTATLSSRAHAAGARVDAAAELPSLGGDG